MKEPINVKDKAWSKRTKTLAQRIEKVTEEIEEVKLVERRERKSLDKSKRTRRPERELPVEEDEAHAHTSVEKKAVDQKLVRMRKKVAHLNSDQLRVLMKGDDAVMKNAYNQYTAAKRIRKNARKNLENFRLAKVSLSETAPPREKGEATIYRYLVDLTEIRIGKFILRSHTKPLYVKNFDGSERNAKRKADEKNALLEKREVLLMAQRGAVIKPSTTKASGQFVQVPIVALTATVLRDSVVVNGYDKFGTMVGFTSLSNADALRCVDALTSGHGLAQPPRKNRKERRREKFGPFPEPPAGVFEEIVTGETHNIAASDEPEIMSKRDKREVKKVTTKEKGKRAMSMKDKGDGHVELNPAPVLQKCLKCSSLDARHVCHFHRAACVDNNLAPHFKRKRKQAKKEMSPVNRRLLEKKNKGKQRRFEACDELDCDCIEHWHTRDNYKCIHAKDQAGDKENICNCDHLLCELMPHDGESESDLSDSERLEGEEDARQEKEEEDSEREREYAKSFLEARSHKEERKKRKVSNTVQSEDDGSSEESETEKRGKGSPIAVAAQRGILGAPNGRVLGGGVPEGGVQGVVEGVQEVVVENVDNIVPPVQPGEEAQADQQVEILVEEVAVQVVVVENPVVPVQPEAGIDGGREIEAQLELLNEQGPDENAEEEPLGSVSSEEDAPTEDKEDEAHSSGKDLTDDEGGFGNLDEFIRKEGLGILGRMHRAYKGTPMAQKESVGKDVETTALVRSHAVVEKEEIDKRLGGVTNGVSAVGTVLSKVEENKTALVAGGPAHDFSPNPIEVPIFYIDDVSDGGGMFDAFLNFVSVGRREIIPKERAPLSELEISQTRYAKFLGIFDYVKSGHRTLIDIMKEGGYNSYAMQEIDFNLLKHLRVTTTTANITVMKTDGAINSAVFNTCAHVLGLYLNLAIKGSNYEILNGTGNMNVIITTTIQFHVQCRFYIEMITRKSLPKTRKLTTELNFGITRGF